MTAVLARSVLLLVMTLACALVRADSMVEGIFSTVQSRDEASFHEAARRARAEAGWWFARHGNVGQEFPGFRGYFIKVRDIGTVDDNYALGAIVTGDLWDRTRAPSFKISFDPGGPASQYVSVANLAFLGRDWHPDYLRIRQALIGRAISEIAENPGIFGIDRNEADYLDQIAREAMGRAGRWMPVNRSTEFAGFRGYFIKVGDGGSVGDNYSLGTIVRGATWDGTDAPRFRHSDGTSLQWMSAVNLTYLGEDWHADFEALSQRLKVLGL